MNHTQVLKRAWKMLWSYRALWVFGIVLAIVTSAWGGWTLYDRDVEWEEQGIPLFLLILVAPLAWLNGLGEVFISSLWTMTYRELQGLARPEPEPHPAVGSSGLEAAPAT